MCSDGSTSGPAAGAPAPAPHPAGDVGPAAAASDDEAPPGAVALVHPVDLTALRAKLPDNLYWELGAPTRDEAVLARRAEEEQRMNDLFGKVQSNTASVEEIHQYHDRRRAISEDYLRFAKLVLEDHGEDLSDEERGLYELSIKMNESRLRDIPRRVEDALDRKRRHDQRRAEWRGESHAP